MKETKTTNSENENADFTLYDNLDVLLIYLIADIVVSYHLTLKMIASVFAALSR